MVGDAKPAPWRTWRWPVKGKGSGVVVFSVQASCREKLRRPANGFVDWTFEQDNECRHPGSLSSLVISPQLFDYSPLLAEITVDIRISLKG